MYGLNEKAHSYGYGSAIERTRKASVIMPFIIVAGTSHVFMLRRKILCGKL